MTLGWTLIAVVIIVAAVLAVAGYRLRPHRNRSNPLSWIGAVTFAIAIGIHAALTDPTWLILVAILPAGYISLRPGNWWRDHREAHQ